eukprot:7418304-Pyramimonas_sp.AAC.1
MGYPPALAAVTAARGITTACTNIWDKLLSVLFHICQSTGRTIRLQIGAQIIGSLQIGLQIALQNGVHIGNITEWQQAREGQRTY